MASFDKAWGVVKNVGGCPQCGTPTKDDSEGYEFCPKRDCDWFEEGLDARHE